MNWTEHLFEYCERGASALFWAEPLNAISNAGFLIAGLGAAYLLLKRRIAQAFGFRIFLIGMLFVIGIGSFLFHTLAMRWAELADQIPITIFVFSYFLFALVFLLRLTRPLAAILLFAFAVLSIAASNLTCTPPPPNAGTDFGDAGCIWGSVAYLPALGGLWLVGLLLLQRSHAAAPSILAAASVFTVSLAIRTLDAPICNFTVVWGKTVGTHFLWHAFNSCTLFLLLRAAIVHEEAPRNATI